MAEGTMPMSLTHEEPLFSDEDHLLSDEEIGGDRAPGEGTEGCLVAERTAIYCRRKSGNEVRFRRLAASLSIVAAFALSLGLAIHGLSSEAYHARGSGSAAGVVGSKGRPTGESGGISQLMERTDGELSPYQFSEQADATSIEKAIGQTLGGGGGAGDGDTATSVGALLKVLAQGEEKSLSKQQEDLMAQLSGKHDEGDAPVAHVGGDMVEPHKPSHVGGSDEHKDAEDRDSTKKEAENNKEAQKSHHEGEEEKDKEDKEEKEKDKKKDDGDDDDDHHHHHHHHRDCEDAKPGSDCYSNVSWAKMHGIFDHPEWYPGIKPYSDRRDFQEHLFATDSPGHCTKPCSPFVPPEKKVEQCSFPYNGGPSEMCFCQLATNEGCAAEGCTCPQGCTGVTWEHEYSVTFRNKAQAAQCPEPTALLTIPKSYFSNIKFLQTWCPQKMLLVIKEMLVSGFSTYNNNVRGGNTGPVHQCIHSARLVSISWLHLHTFCPEGIVDGMPSVPAVAWCSVMEHEDQAHDLAQQVIDWSIGMNGKMFPRAPQNCHEMGCNMAGPAFVCSCNPECEKYGDCCDDYEAECKA